MWFYHFTVIYISDILEKLKNSLKIARQENASCKGKKTHDLWKKFAKLKLLVNELDDKIFSYFSQVKLLQSYFPKYKSM